MSWPKMAPSIRFRLERADSANSSDYRAVAQMQGVIMMTTAGKGHGLVREEVLIVLIRFLGVIGNAVNLLDNAAAATMRWAGDHIFELNMLKLALLEFGDEALNNIMFNVC